MIAMAPAIRYRRAKKKVGETRTRDSVKGLCKSHGNSLGSTLGRIRGT